MERILLTDPETTARIFRIVGVGGVAIVPTDTVYGLIADATNEKAIEKIFVIKKRDIRKPLGIFVRDRDMLKEYILADENLLDKLFSIWPGALTAIFTPKKRLPYQDTNTIGVRIPASSFLDSLMKRLDGPLTQTSANISGHGSFTRVRDVEKDLAGTGDIDVFVDGGDLPDSMVSSAVDFTVHQPKLIREGGVSRRKLEQIFGPLQW